MALSLSRRKQNAKAFELVFHEERLRGQLRQQAEDRVQQTVAQAQDRFGNLRLAGALNLGSEVAGLGTEVAGLNVDAAPVAGDLGFLHDQLSLALAGFDGGLLGADASNSAVADAMGGGLPGFDAGYSAGTASAQDAAMRDAVADGEQLDLANPAVKNMHSRGGAPLPAAVAARLGAAFGHDFAHVRVHTDAAAAAAAEALNARAFAVGADIWFGRGAFNPGTAEGDRILAHELTHVVQADEGRLPSPSGEGLSVSSPTDSAEREAYANEKSIPAAMGTGSTTALADAPLAGETSPHIAGVSLAAADVAAPAAAHDAGREGTQTEATDGALMRDFLGKKRSGQIRPPGAPRPGGEAPVELVKGMLDKAGVDPAARPDNGGPGLEGAVKAPAEMLNSAVKNAPGLSGALKPADMDVADRNGNRPTSLIAGDGLNLNVKLGNKNAGVNISANLGGKDGNNVAVNGALSDGKNNTVNVNGKAGDGGNSLGVNGSVGDDKNRVNFDGKVGDGGGSFSADAKLADGLVNASLSADGNGLQLDAKLGDKVDDSIKDKVKEVAQELTGNKTDDKADEKKGDKPGAPGKEGEKGEDEEKEGEEKEGEEKEGEGKDGEAGPEGEKKEGGPGGPGGGEAKSEGQGGEGGGAGGPVSEEGGGAGGPGQKGPEQGGPIAVRALSNLQLPAFNLKKDEEAGLKKKTGMTPAQHQQQIQQHVDRIKSQVDQMREGLRVYAETKVQAIELEITTAKEALGGDVSAARGKISGAYASARGGLSQAAVEAQGAVASAATAAREALAASLPAQLTKLTEAVATGKSTVDGLAPTWKASFKGVLDTGAKGFETAANKCAEDLAKTKDTIVNTWADEGDALQRAENEARRKAASKGVDDAVADFRSGGATKAAAAKGQQAIYDQQIDAALNAVKGAFDQMATQGATALNTANTNALAQITAQSTEAGGAIEAAKTRASGALSTAETAALGEVDNVLAQQGQSLDNTSAQARSNITGADAQLRERYAQWFDGVLAGIPKDQATTYDQVKEFLEGKERELPGFNATVMGELDTACETARQMVVDASGAARSALTRLADGQAQSAANQGRQQADGIRATGRQFAQGIRATGSAVETAYQQHIAPMQTNINGRLALTESQVVAAMDAAKTDLEAQATAYEAQLRQRIAQMPQTLTPMANAAAAGLYRVLSTKAQGVHTACKGMGTDESGVYNALRGLTALQGQALETVVWPRLFAAEGSLRSFIIDDMNEDEQKIAFAYLGGNTALGARLELHANIRWYGDDEAQIEKILRELSPEDLAAMKADPAWAATRQRLVDNLGGTDLDVTKALIAGNTARADAYRLRDKIDEARRSRDPDALADALAGVDPAQLAAVQQEFVNIQNKVDPEATNVPPVDPAVAATQLADYATRDIAAYDPNTGEMRTDSVTGANRDLVRALAVQGRDSVEAATSRFEVERTRAGGPNMERMETALMAPADLQAALHNPDPAVQERARQQQQQREDAMKNLYQQQYGGPEGRTMDQAIAGTFQGRNDKEAETSRRLMQNMLNDGYNSPRVAADMIFLAADGAGTNEAQIKRALNGMRPDEVQALATTYQQVHGDNLYERLGVAERDANGNKIPGRDHASNQWFNELSGDDRREVEMLLQGDPQYMSPQQQMALARTQYDWQRGSESGAMGRWMMDGSAEQQDLDRNFAALTELNGRMEPDGTFKNPADKIEYERLCGDVGINAAQYQAATDRTANYITTGVAIVGAVVVTAATFGSGAPAGAAMIMAAAGTAASGAISMGVNAGMKGGRYGWEQAATDAGITAVNTLTAGAGAYMKGAQMGVGALGKVGAEVAIDGGMGLINGAAQTAMTDGTWDKGFWHGMGEVGIGGARQSLTDMASSAVSTGIEETKLGQAIENSGNIWRTAAFKGATNAAGGVASTLTGIGFDTARGKGPTDLSSVAEQVGSEGAKQFVIGAGGGALGGAIRNRRGRQAPPSTPPAGPGGDPNGPPPPGTSSRGPDNDTPPSGGGGAAVDPGTPRGTDTSQRPVGNDTNGTTTRPPSAPSQDPNVDANTGRQPAGTQSDASTQARQRDATGGQGGRNDTDGQVIRDANTGETTVTTPKGVTRADDTGVVTKNRDGSTDFVDAHGNRTTTTPDGTSRTILADGTVIVRDADGTAVAVKDDVAVRLDAQGKPMREDGQPMKTDDASREQAVFDRVDQMVQQGKLSHEQAWAIVARSGDVGGQEAALRAAEQRIAQDDAVINRLVDMSKQVGPDGQPVVHPRDLDAVIDAPDPIKALQVLEARVANKANDTTVRQNIDAATKADAQGGAFVDDVFDNITVGAGFAGISNEISARGNGAQGKRLVVGGENPWMRANADLGQRAGESEVPGGVRPMASTADSNNAAFMKARQHAENVEINRADAGIGVLSAKIDGVELRSQMPPGATWHKDAAARIRISDGVNADGSPKFRYVYANHVDIASGPGPARDLSTKPGPDGKPAQIDPDLYRQLKSDGRIMHGDQSFDGAGIRPGEKVLVFGAGAAGAWGAEGSYKNAGEVEWLGRMARPSDDMPGPQKARLEGMYDRLADARTRGDEVAAQRAMAEIERFTFTEARGNGFLPRNQRPGAAFDPSMQADAGGKITRSVTDDVKSVTFETNPATGRKQIKMVGNDGQEFWADRVVLTIGQDGEAAGGPGQLLGKIQGMTPLIDGSGREFPFPVVVGVESGDGAVRVIGAAATSPAVRKRIESGFRDMVDENFMMQSTHSSVPTDSNGVVGSFHHAERMIRSANRETLIRLAKADAATQQRIIGGHDDAWSVKAAGDADRTRVAPELPRATGTDPAGGSTNGVPRTGDDQGGTPRTDTSRVPGPELTGPAASQAVTTPKQGETPLIGLHTDFFDPKASGTALRDQLSQTGVPRQQKLSAAERAVESQFADWVQSNPKAATEGALRLAQAAGNPDQPVFEVDAMKRLLPEYGAGGKPASPEEHKFRLEMNHALHPTAVAIARAAFVDRLDTLAALPDGHPSKQVFVTNGGCAAGKGSLTGIVKDAMGDQAKFGAVWDAAGEGDALENGWILKAAQARGLKVVFGYAEADPTTRYQGVLNRAEGSGRVVDVLTFVNSYSDGADSFRRFLDSPEYKRAVADGHAAAFGISPGEFDAASLKDKSKPAFPDLKNLNPNGSLRAEDVSNPPNKQQALDASLRILEDYVKTQRAAGKDPDAVARGALENAMKFLDGQPPEVRASVLASYARIFGTPAPVAPTGTGTTPANAGGAAQTGTGSGAQGGPTLTRPQPGQSMTSPKRGETPLIGLHADHFDPHMSADDMATQLAKGGMPRQPKLSASERAAESSFADWVEKHPNLAKHDALEMAKAIGNPDQPIFEVDAMKRLLPEYGSGSKPANDQERAYRLENNHALHPTAVAIARMAFTDRLDVLAKLPDGHPLKQVFVTSGGCAAGKGDLTGIVKDAMGDKATFGAVWDAAGEGDATENAWILKAAQARGIKVVYGYAEADPTTRYQSVLERAGGSGRVVDVMTFINSYVDGATEMKRFMESPEYKKAVADKQVSAFGIAPGEFNRASLTDKSQKAYPDVKPLNATGDFEAQHVGAPADRQKALEASLKILEDFVQSERAKGKDPTAVARGALENAIKFLDNEPPEIRDAVLASYARIFGGSSP